MYFRKICICFWSSQSGTQCCNESAYQGNIIVWILMLPIRFELRRYGGSMWLISADHLLIFGRYFRQFFASTFIGSLLINNFTDQVRIEIFLNFLSPLLVTRNIYRYFNVTIFSLFNMFFFIISKNVFCQVLLCEYKFQLNSSSFIFEGVYWFFLWFIYCFYFVMDNRMSIRHWTN